MTKISDLYRVDNELVKELFDRYTYPFEIIPKIHDFILEIGNKLGDDYNLIGKDIWIHKSARISDNVEIIGPAIIMDNVTLKHNAFIRGNAIIGSGSVVGNSCEIKNSILISNSQIPHFNYVGDSILGHKVHLGAGVILANLRLDEENIKIEKMNTNLQKLGAFIGDNVQIGCNSVVCPGTIIYPNSIIYPLTTVKGVIKNGESGNDYEVKRI